MYQVGTVVTAPAKVSVDLQPQPWDMWASELRAIVAPSLQTGTADAERRVKLSHKPFLQVLTKLQFVSEINYVIVSSH